MNAMDIFLIGVGWIMTAAALFGLVGAGLLATWMQVRDKKEAGGASADEGQACTPAVHKRRRAAA